MRQIVQNYNDGDLRIEDVPTPICKRGSVLVRTMYSVVSAGTERMKVQQARMNLLAKAKARPDKVRQVIQSVRQSGLKETYQKVRERLGALTPLGYSLAGVVEAVGEGIDDLRVGDTVACGGEGIACHAEYVCVPRNLCARVPDGVLLQDAAFSTIGSIAMNGVRQAGVTIGDSVVVIGLGLVGLLAVQILKAAGCRVIGIDLDPEKVELARACGADLALPRGHRSLRATVRDATHGAGVDVAYIAASTQSGDPMELAAELVRDRGRVVVVGMVPIEADWRTCYMKEISLVMARSYGPGRYDPNYEQRGVDYPIGYVRWTEQRNLEEFLRLVQIGAIEPAQLAPRTFSFEDAAEAYELLRDKRAPIAIVFEYPQEAPARTLALPRPRSNGHAGRNGHGENAGQVGVGLIGAGNFATGTLIPALKQIASAKLRAVCSATGLSAASAARRHGFEYSAADYSELLDDPGVQAVLIATRHDTHARFAADALRAGKAVFVEKPLALNEEQLRRVLEAQSESGGLLMPGFNRRFSPLAREVRDFFADRAGPLEVLCRVNAGGLSDNSWYRDSDQGGWRIVSEGCHFIDLIQFLCGCPPVRVHAEMIGGRTPGGQNDNCAVTLTMADGSLGMLMYIADGDTRLDKERVEVFGQGRSAVIDGFHDLEIYPGGSARRVHRKGRGKGHYEELAAFVEAVRTGGANPLPLDQAVSTTLACLAIEQALLTREPQSIPEVTQEARMLPAPARVAS